jgi:predicted negative regulator of RcsB-dependent stress response
MSDTEIKFVVIGWLLIIVFVIGRNYYRKQQFKKKQEQLNKTGERLYKILNQVEKLKNKK